MVILRTDHSLWNQKWFFNGITACENTLLEHIYILFYVTVFSFFFVLRDLERIQLQPATQEITAEMLRNCQKIVFNSYTPGSSGMVV